MRRMPIFLVGALLLVSSQGARGQDYTKDPNFGDLQLKESFLPDPRSVTVTSGGDVEVEVSGCDYGHVSDAPDVDLYYTTTGGTGLYVYVEGDGDTMLLVNTPDGEWVCDDDGHGDVDPLVYIPAAEDGLYDIWVGSYSDESYSATLYVSEVEPDDGSAGGPAPDISLGPTYGDVSLGTGFRPDPRAVSVIAGGDVSIADLPVDLTGCTYGHVSSAPDVDLHYTVSRDATLYIYAGGANDTMLLVNRPDGTWLCDDDGLGEDRPVVVIPAAESGLYDIWVGTSGDEVGDAILYISERDPR